MGHLLPERKKITEQIATLQAQSIPQATKQIYMICSAALADINARWDEKVPPMLARRIKVSACSSHYLRLRNVRDENVPLASSLFVIGFGWLLQEGFDALLPSETLEPVKRTCINLALERCLAKTNEWRQTHMLEIGKWMDVCRGTYVRRVCTVVNHRLGAFSVISVLKIQICIHVGLPGDEYCSL